MKTNIFSISLNITRKKVAFAFLGFLLLGILPKISLSQVQPMRIDKIQLESKYEVLEKTASPALKQELTAIRTIGIQKNFTFQVGVTSVAKFNIREITGAILPTGNSVPAGSTQAGAPPPMGGSVGNANATSFDLRSLGLVTPVRDQGQCGSCWAFAAIASFESANALRNKVNANSFDLSEQQMLNCAGAGTCGGGQEYMVLDYLKGHTANSEASYPYTHTDHGCTTQNGSNYKVENWGWVGSNHASPTIQEIKNAIVNYASVATWIWVNKSYQYYTGGVLNDNTRNPNSNIEGGHFVEIIGWNNNLHAWLIKNSWGTDWGMSGFAWVDYNVLGIGSWATWAVANAVAVAPPAPQTAWRYCQKCHAMFYDGYAQKGACPAGGGHLAQGFMFALPHDVAATNNAQNLWRYCDKCHAMFYDGYTPKGNCAAGGAHNAQGYMFVLPHDITVAGKNQNAWRYCQKCHVMFYDGYTPKGVCASGGAHQAQGFMFVLPYQ